MDFNAGYKNESANELMFSCQNKVIGLCFIFLFFQVYACDFQIKKKTDLLNSVNLGPFLNAKSFSHLS